MGFKDLYSKLRDPGDDVLPDDIYDQIQSAYDDDISTREAKIAELDSAAAKHAEALQGKDSEISRLKAMNFDLLTSTKAGSGTEDTGEADGNHFGHSDGSADDENEGSGIESLFERGG